MSFSSGTATTPPAEILLPWKALRRTGPERLHDMVTSLRGRPLVRIFIGPREFWMSSDAEVARHVLQENAKAYKKSDSYEELHPFLGLGLFTADGESWKRQRRLAQPAFHAKQLAELTATMVDETAKYVAELDRRPRGASFDMNADMVRLTLTVVGRTLCGVDLASDAETVGPALSFVLHDTDRRMLAPLRVPRQIPTLTNLRYAYYLSVLNRRVNALIRERRTRGYGKEGPKATSRADLLGMLLDAKDDAGDSLTDKQLRDEVMTIVLAGHETTANALSWAFYLLSRHPEADRKVHEEVRRVLGDRAPTFADIPQLKYTGMVIQEAMRLFPPVWVVERSPLEDDSVLGYRVPKGTRVGIVTYAIHHNPEYWPNPEGFDPERFATDGKDERPKFAYLPFGGGPRICIGNNFAMMEAQIILAMVLGRYRVELEPAHPVEPELMLTLRPRNGVRVTLRPRTPSARPQPTSPARLTL